MTKAPLLRGLAFPISGAAILVGLVAYAQPKDRPSPHGSAVGDAVVLALHAEDGACEPGVLLLLDEHSSPGVPSGQADRIFRLQVRDGPFDLDEGRLPGARVVWTETRVEARSDNGSVVLTLDPREPDEAGVPGRRVLHGFGLAHFTGHPLSVPGRDLGPDAISRLKADLLPLFAGCEGFDDCRAGGSGAAGCTYACGGQQCGVACSEGEPCCGCAADGAPCCICKGGDQET